LKFIEGNWSIVRSRVSTLKKVLVEAFDKFGGEFMGHFWSQENARVSFILTHIRLKL